MSTAVTPPPADDPVAVSDIEAELARRVSSFKGTSEGPVLRARMSNLMIYCDSAKLAEEVTAVIPAVAGQHPARVLLLVAEATADTAPVKASVKVWSQTGTKVRICTEQVTLRAAGDAVSELAFAVRGLLIGDLPINLWWAAHVPPALGGAMLSDLAERAQQVIYDSIGWLEPARGVAMMATWLGKFEREPGQGEWSVASDLNWRRLKYWRRLLGQALDPATAPGALTSITDVYVEHGPRAVVQAWELVSWLAARLGWQVRQGRVQPGVEIGWDAEAPHGRLRVRVHRLAAGPSEVRRVRIACNLDGTPTALNVTVEDERRLAVVLEGLAVAPRTVTVQPQPLAELVARQLSDRERDPVFRESMAVAQVFAQSVLH
ncbi:MAG TPA: glucose-6-phosphate dehydrogenase assembly protein OpcA [Gemmataceae bacterium]|nr:glucose-6-phosphate dehydrogenase assembly protein OpcA [Gemmataceae bacterium]